MSTFAPINGKWRNSTTFKLKRSRNVKLQRTCRDRPIDHCTVSGQITGGYSIAAYGNVTLKSSPRDVFNSKLFKTFSTNRCINYGLWWWMLAKKFSRFCINYFTMRQLYFKFWSHIISGKVFEVCTIHHARNVCTKVLNQVYFKSLKFFKINYKSMGNRGEFEVSIKMKLPI